MKLNQTQLNHYLKTSDKNNIPALYWINCEDGYLLNDCLKKIKKHIAQNTTYEKIIFHLDNTTNWSDIKNYFQTPGLFSDIQLIELHFTTKITTEQQTELGIIAEQFSSNQHTKCIIVYPFRIESKVLQQKWLLKLDAHGIIITIWPPSNTEYPNWLRQECIRYQITIEDFDYFCQRTMGNPSIAAQTLYKLKLQDITLATKTLLEKTLDLHANYSIFDLIDNYLLANIKKCFIILKSLKNNDHPELLILWSLRKELFALAEILEQSAQKKLSPQKVLQDNKTIWSAKKNNLSYALQSLNLDLIYQSLNKITTIEKSVKTENDPAFVWQEIEQLFLLRTNLVLFDEL